MKLPSQEKLSYLKLLAETVLLLLLVPVIAIAFLRDPQSAIDHGLGKVR